MTDTNFESSTPEPDDLRRRMAECVSLPPADPARRALVAELAGADESVRREWVRLVADDERMRLELQNIDPPASLHARLKALPDDTADAPVDPIPLESPAPRRPAGRIGTRPWIAAAAALLIGVSVWLALGPLGSAAYADRLHTFSSACVEHLLANRPLTVVTSDLGELTHQLEPDVPFDFHIPDLTGEDYTLVGARPCHIEHHDIVQTRWKRDGHEWSLYVYCPSDFDLPDAFDQLTVHLSRPASDGARRDVRLWSDAHCAYALVPAEGEPVASSNP